LEAKKYDGKADVWSVGCIYYEMLFGKAPFDGKSEFQLLDIINKTILKNIIPNDYISESSVEDLHKVLIIFII
jgi:serine/threonine protein kinase